MNHAIGKKLETFDQKPFQKREGSCATSLAEENPFLLLLPVTPFKLAVWKVATVSTITWNYSVQNKYSKRRVVVHLTRTTEESTLPVHASPFICISLAASTSSAIMENCMSPDYQTYLQWNRKRFVRWAELNCQHTAAVAGVFLFSHKVDQQGLKSFMALQKLADLFFPACGEHLQKSALFTSSPSLKSIQSILKSVHLSTNRIFRAKRGAQSPQVY